MTACNIFAAPDAAYLMTDTAIMRGDGSGRVWHFCSKVVQCRRLRIAAALTGEANVHELEDGQLASPLGVVEHVFASAATQRDALSALPAALEQAYTALHEMTGGEGNFVVMVVLWDTAANEAQAYVVPSPNVAQMPGVRPFKLMRVTEFISPGVDGGLDDPRGLFEAQRKTKADRGSVAGFHTVGGEGRLTRIDRNGIATETLVRWPDRVGRKIVPDRRRWIDQFTLRVPRHFPHSCGAP